jgi:uncharacterized protein DUF3618
MTNSDTPTDPEQLREEIARTRAELGQTVESLAAKTDVKARAKDAVAAAGDRVREKVSTVADRATQKAGVVKEQAAGAVAKSTSAVKQKVSQGDRPLPVRRPLPLAAIGAAAVLIGLVVYVVRRKRS